ncbi:MAG: pyruvate kinase [Solirubrobacterales bacterium]
MRKTKIVATVGPATSNPQILAGLISVGADVLRLNFSHGTPDSHHELIKTARQASERAGREVGLLGDLPGPKLRVGEIDGGVLTLSQGQELKLDTRASTSRGRRNVLPIPWPELPSCVGEGDQIYLADGTIRLSVRSAEDGEVLVRVETPGTVASRQGINVPGADVGPTALGEADMEWLDFAIDEGIEIVAVSFVRSAADLDPVKSRLAERGVDLPIVAKIEKREAVEAAEEIVKSADGGIMVARGDLGIELPIEEMPLAQKRLLALAGRYSKPSITATQMLASMVSSPRPTRAEATDVANAIFDGTDALMLSQETAVGEFPVESVRTMAKIAEHTEEQLNYGELLLTRTGRAGADVADTVSYGAVGAVYQLGLAALVVPTRSGRTARLVSAHRPRVPVIALSPRPETVRRLNLLFGVVPALHEEPKTINELLESCAEHAKQMGLVKSGDLIGITAGLGGQQLGTNLFEVHRVP